MRWRRLTRNPLSFAALCTILVVTAAALLAPWVAPHHPDEPDAEATLSGVSLRHPLGTDMYGRDQLSRLIHAGRVDLVVALSATAMALSVGTTLGALAGYRGGWVVHLLMRTVDAVMAFPAFILAMAITAALGNSTVYVVVAIAITHVPIDDATIAIANDSATDFTGTWKHCYVPKSAAYIALENYEDTGFIQALVTADNTDPAANTGDNFGVIAIDYSYNLGADGVPAGGVDDLSENGDVGNMGAIDEGTELIDAFTGDIVASVDAAQSAN